jgi:hypothetical protein
LVNCWWFFKICFGIIWKQTHFLLFFINTKILLWSLSNECSTETDYKHQQSSGVETLCNENRLVSLCSKWVFNTMALAFIWLDPHCSISLDRCSFFLHERCLSKIHFLVQNGSIFNSRLVFFEFERQQLPIDTALMETCCSATNTMTN